MSFIQAVFQFIYQISFTVKKCLRYFSILVLENEIKYVHLFVNWTNFFPLCSGKWALTDKLILIYSLHKQGQYNKASSMPISRIHLSIPCPKWNWGKMCSLLTCTYVPLCSWNGTSTVSFQILCPSLNLKILPDFISHAFKRLSSEHIQLHSFKISNFL